MQEVATTPLVRSQPSPPNPSLGGGFMRMVWHDLLFMHWQVDADQLRQTLPSSLTLDTYQGKAWIGVVPFRMSGVSLRWMPDLPWLSRFPELNVRTYVIGPDGRRGVWFHSLDATNPVAVRGARWLYSLNYVDANIKFAKEKGCDCGSWIRYDSNRTHRGEAEARLKVEYRPIGSDYLAKEGSLDRWLTSRYSLFSANSKGHLFRGDIEHPEWHLRDAQAIIHENTMTNGLGIELPDEAPLLHFACKTKVKAGRIRRVD